MVSIHTYLIVREREKMSNVMSKSERIAYEFEWCKIELDNIKAGIFSMYSQEYIEGALSVLHLFRGIEGAEDE